MLENEDAKTLIGAYKYIERTCNAIDEYIFKHAINYGPDPELSSTYDVINNIINLMERKNKLIRLKNIIDETVDSLSEEYKKIIILKMRFKLSTKVLQKMLNYNSERTAFRRIEQAIESFRAHLNRITDLDSVEDVIKKEKWIFRIKQSYLTSQTVG